jgi:VIT1/CCC1 family predicted Fe2+/Mn2+ transporter
MAEPTHSARPGALEPMHRLSEMLFGLIMVLTFTGSFSVVSGAVDVRTMLLAALGCGIAWGLIDAVMYLLGCLHDSGAELQKVRALRAARTQEAARETVRLALPPYAAREVDAAIRSSVAAAVLVEVPADARPGLTRADMRGAVNVFLVVIAANLPVVLPFLIIQDTFTALRVSNGVALVMLAVIGHAYGRVSGMRPWRTSVAMVVLGAVLVALTIALGG